MIRDPVVLWGIVGLVIILAFVLIPSYEHFKDASGKETDVSPDAPPMPAGLCPTDERTGKTTCPPGVSAPSGLGGWLLGKETFDVPTTPDAPPAPPAPSGVRVIPSQSMPPNALLGTINSAVGTDSKSLTRTIPGPPVQAGPQGIQGEDKYVLKSSLLPCTTGSKVPGTTGGNADDDIKKPFSEAFPTDENGPVGYLNSFNAFMK